MSELGRNGITLTAVSDACSVVFSPSSCVVHADFDGSNPVLTYAYTDINVVRGDVKLAITTSDITIPSKSNSNITYSLTAIDNYTVRLQITAIPTTILNGNLGVKVTLGAFEILSSFPFTVVRESSMLDWIQDWDGRRTSIGGASIVTPKIFAGSKDSDNSLTGVYLGPDTAGAGIYGYKAVPDPSNTGHTITSEVFHINSNGASIGGWNIETGGITTVDSVSGYSLQLLSSGSIIAKDDNDATIYALDRSGEASFAKGNVLFHADGSAKFVGEIQAGSGKIGNWLISENAIHKAHVVLDSNVSAIMILAADNYQNTANAYTAALKMYGGVKMYYTSSGDYGMEAWLPATEETVGDAVVTQYHQAFALGSSNFIAGWHFDDEKLYGTYAMIVGTNGNAGLYVSSSDISGVAVSGLTTSIAAGTGIYITAHNNFHELAGYAGGNLVFRLGTNGNQIAGWNFTAGNIFCGSTTMSSDGFTGSSGSMLISTQTGIVGYKWMFKSDGSGKLAGGKIEWDASGNLTFLGGTVKSGSGNNPAWVLNPDGSGSFASGKIQWTAAGSLSLTGILSVSSNGCVQLSNAGICSESPSGVTDPVRFWAGQTHANRDSAPFKVTQSGNIYATQGSLTGLTVKKSRSPFVYNDPAIYIGGDEPEDYNPFINNDNAYSDLSGGMTVVNDKELPCDISQSGRRIINCGSCTLRVPNGYHIYINGTQFQEAEFINEIVELIGFGTKDTFYGWILVSRNYYITTYAYGRPMTPLAVGYVKGSSNGASFTCKKTFDNSKIFVERISAGEYQLIVPRGWFASESYIYVGLTGVKLPSGVSQIKASLESVEASTYTYTENNASNTINVWKITIYTSDDSTVNEGAFQFMLYNMNQW